MKIYIIGMVWLLSVGGSYAQKPDADKFFYDKGFKDGKVEGMRIGYERAKKEVLKKLKSRLNAIKAMEAGKYLSKKHKITAPQIYQVRKADGSLSVMVKGCRLEGELTPEEIVLLPTSEAAYGDNTPQAEGLFPSTLDASRKEHGVSNSVFLPGVDATSYSTPQMATRMTDTVYKYLPNTKFYVRLLRSSGYPFTITHGGTNVKVRFSSEQEALTFLRRYDLEPGRDVK